jgi:hypothetical protein
MHEINWLATMDIKESDELYKVNTKFKHIIGISDIQ